MRGGSKDILCNYPKPLFQSDAKHEAIINDFFYSHANKTYYQQKKIAFAVSLILKVRVFNISYVEHNKIEQESGDFLKNFIVTSCYITL